MKPASEGKSDLSRRTVYGYGLGEFGYSFYLNLISSYLMFYMTDVLLLPTKLTGILYSAVQWVEAATASRTRASMRNTDRSTPARAASTSRKVTP